MKTLWATISIIAVAHMLAILALVAFLLGTDRIDRQRFDQVRSIFVTTIAQETAEAEAKAEVEKIKADEQKWLNSLDDANTGIDGRIERLEKQDDLINAKNERFNEDRKQHEAVLNNKLKEIAKQLAILDRERKAFQDEVERQKQLVQDVQFQKMVGILKGLPAEQLKTELDVYIQKGEIDRVVDIINAFDKRTSSKLFEQYQTPEDQILAADLLVRLKELGSVNGIGPSTDANTP